MQVSKISFSNPQFPDQLHTINNAPKSINILGILPKGIYVAIVGTRKATTYSEKVTYQLASELAAAGAVIISWADALNELRFAARKNVISLMEITGKVRNLGASQWVRR